MDSRRGVLTGLHILVVEDDIDARAILQSLLGYFGALVTVATGVRDGVQALRDMAPDVVITDMVLGRSTGFVLLDEARSAAGRMPFIAVSARDFDAHELERAGFAAYLRKPLDHNKLVDVILTVARRG